MDKFDKVLQLIKELRDAQALTDEQLRRNAIEQAKTDEQMKKTDEQIKATDEQMKRTDEQIKRTDAKLDKISKMVGNISNNQGNVAEEFFWNSISDKPTVGGITYDYAEKNRHKKIGDIEDEWHGYRVCNPYQSNR